MTATKKNSWDDASVNTPLGNVINLSHVGRYGTIIVDINKINSNRIGLWVGAAIAVRSFFNTTLMKLHSLTFTLHTCNWWCYSTLWLFLDISPRLLC